MVQSPSPLRVVVSGSSRRSCSISCPPFQNNSAKAIVDGVDIFVKMLIKSTTIFFFATFIFNLGQKFIASCGVTASFLVWFFFSTFYVNLIFSPSFSSLQNVLLQVPWPPSLLPPKKTHCGWTSSCGGRGEYIFFFQIGSRDDELATKCTCDQNRFSLTSDTCPYERVLPQACCGISMEAVNITSGRSSVS